MLQLVTGWSGLHMHHTFFITQATNQAHPKARPSRICLLQVKRMLYRARQRGHLELDLIVGLWAEENVPLLKPLQLRQLQEVLECENPDLFKWLTGQDRAPSDLASNGMFKVSSYAPWMEAVNQGWHWHRRCQSHAGL